MLRTIKLNFDMMMIQEPSDVSSSHDLWLWSGHELKERLSVSCNVNCFKYDLKIWFIVFNATFSNISAISWRF